MSDVANISQAKSVFTSELAVISNYGFRSLDRNLLQAAKRSAEPVTCRFLSAAHRSAYTREFRLVAKSTYMATRLRVARPKNLNLLQVGTRNFVSSTASRSTRAYPASCTIDIGFFPRGYS
jgi:phosphatidylserine/phosphatidylglycerophosphate/cardiolipin synthase-like enzyme